MASVDDRIVAMKFDNAAFQEKVAATIQSLDALKKNLDFSNAKKGMDDLSAAGRGFNLDGIGSAVDGIAGKFTAMGVIAFTVISNIASRAVDAGISIVKSLSLDQVLSGFHEYETNMNAIQTIMANTKADGSTLDDVNKALDTLNTYSDQTIYNFSQMAKNVGTFTAAGVNLDTSVGAIKGIANLAAVSGSNADQASTAMYQLSQALASGSVKLMDWNSIVNAGMGGEVFQKALFETGKALGTIKDVPLGQTFDQWKDAGNTFRDSLQDGWITADVLTNTLAGFTGDLTADQIKAMGYTDQQTADILAMGVTAKGAATEIKTLTQLVGTVKESIGSGWTKSFQIVFGTFDEAKTLFTDINNAIGAFVSKSADARNSVLQSWKDLGGRTALIEGIKTAFLDIVNILKPIKNAFRDIFPAATGQSLFNFTERFKTLMEALTPSPATVVLLQRAFRGVFAAISIGIDVVKGIFGFFHELFQLFTVQGDPNDGILGFAARLGDKILNLKNILDRSNGIKDFFSNLAVEIKHLVTVASRYFDEFMVKVADVIDYFKGGFEGLYTNEGEGIYLFANKVGTALGNIKNWIEGLFGGGVNNEGEKTFDLFGRLGDRVGWLTGLGHILSEGWGKLSDKFATVRDTLSNISDAIKDKVGNIPQAIANTFSGTDYSQVLSTVDVGLFGGFVLLVKKFVDSNPLKDLDKLSDKVSGLFDGLTGTLGAMQDKLKSEALLNIAKAVGLLTASMVVLSLIDSDKMTSALTAMAIGFGQLVTVMALLNKIVSGPQDAAKLALIGTSLVIVAGAILLLSVAAKIMSTMNWEELSKGLLGVGVLLGVISVAVKPLSDNKGGMIATGIGLVAIAVALNILVLAVKAFAEMSWAEMAQGMAGVGTGLGLIAGGLKLMPNGGTMALQGFGLLEISIALNILVLAVKSFADMSWGAMVKGMVGMAGALLILAGALALMPNGISLALQGAGMVLIGTGLISIATAVTMMSKMNWGEIAKGLVALAGTLIVLAIGLEAMSGTMLGAASLLLASIALKGLAKALKEFSKLGWGELLHGLGALVGVLAALGISALLLEPAIPAMFLLGAALVVIGAGFALFGVGANLVASAFAILATAGTQGISTLVDALNVLIKAMPSFIGAFADGLVLLAQKVLEALPGLLEQVGKVIPALLKVLRDAFPDIVETGFALLMALLKGIQDHIGEITTTVIGIILNFVTALTDRLGDIISAGVDLLVALLKGVQDNLDKIVGAVLGIIIKIVTELGSHAVELLGAGKDVIIKVIEGLGTAAIEIVTAITTFLTDFIAKMGESAVDLAQAGKDVILKVINGFGTATVELINGVFQFLINFLNQMADAIDTYAPQLREAGLNLVRAIIEGLVGKSALGMLKDAAINMAKGIIDPFNIFMDSHSPSRKFIAIAGQLVAGLAIGLNNSDEAEKSSAGLANRVMTSFQNAMSELPTAIAGMDEFNPTITPVLDLTKVVNTAKSLGGILGTDPTLAANAAYNQAVLLSMSTQLSTDPEAEAAAAKPTEIKFEQNNYSPEALSTADIYRQTRSQIAMAKEELAVT